MGKAYHKPIGLLAMLGLLAVLALLLLPGDHLRRQGARPELMVLALGDSLTAGHGLRPSQSFAAVLQNALEARGINAQVINAGVSGDTSLGGAARLRHYLKLPLDAAIVELGINDNFRGIPPGRTKAALEGIIQRLSDKGIPILLCGMRAPARLGWNLPKKFMAIYPGLAFKHRTLYYPFFLAGVAGRPELHLADGLHPNAAGVQEMVRRIMPRALRLVELARRKKAKSKGSSIPPAK